jgi:hypothetical protein
MAWQVITQFYNTRKVKAWIKEVPVKLGNIQDGGENFDEYIDYFDTKQEAREHYEDALSQ